MKFVFETERLIVRHVDIEADLEFFYAMNSNPEVIHFIRSGKVIESLDKQREELNAHVERYIQRNNGSGAWPMVSKDTNQVVGNAILNQIPLSGGELSDDWQVGWHLRRDCWGKGYATEVGKALLTYGFTVLQRPILYAVVDPLNHASRRVTERLGMTFIERTNKYYDLELDHFQKLPSEHDAQLFHSENE
jgi:[ribosomal protein S5]-alanine N-acetyltransferase